MVTNIIIGTVEIYDNSTEGLEHRWLWQPTPPHLQHTNKHVNRDTKCL